MMGKLEDLHELLNVDENASLFYDQINNEDEDYTTPKVDHFTELYNSYSEIFEDENLPQDDLSTVIDQFTQICCHIINYINDKFNTDPPLEGSRAYRVGPGLFRFRSCRFPACFLLVFCL